MASDYERRDPAQSFAERRGITLGERIAEIAHTAAEKARDIFDGLRLSLPGRDLSAPAAPERPRDIFEGLDLSRATPTVERDLFARFQPAPQDHDATRQQRRGDGLQPLRGSGLRGAVERYAKALDAIHQTRAQGIDAMPHQREALDRARSALDAIRPEGSTDLDSAFRTSPELVREAVEGRGHEAIRAMQVEAEIRIDPFSRADRFVAGWQNLKQQHDELVRDGNFRGAKTTAQHMSDMAKSLERDAQLESLLGLRSRELGIEAGQSRDRSLGHDLATSIPRDHSHDHGRGMDR
jgi:hypothetical protein